jgi:hypothetical protein
MKRLGQAEPLHPFSPAKANAMSYRTGPEIFIFILTRLLPVIFLLAGTPVSGAEIHENFNVEGHRIEKENLLDLVFGSPPPMATERGILIIDAFHDLNGNGRRDADEGDLDEGVFCLVDDIEYAVPAFIPGLAYDGSYKVLCAGDRYRPTVSKENVFVRQRGQIITLDLPCE